MTLHRVEYEPSPDHNQLQAASQPSVQQSSVNTLIAKCRLCSRSHQRGHTIVNLKRATTHRSPIAPS